MNEIIVTSQQEMFLPVMNVELAIERRNRLVKFVQGIMKDGHDFGKIPGAGDKPTLFKPGAEKLATFFGLTPVFVPASVTEDWTGTEHAGEPFFYYRYKCELYRAGTLIATAEASCNSHESKYRYRKGERVCPQCGAAAIIKGKAEYGGGWICFGKRGGCGAKFKADDPEIASQEVGRIINPDVADQVNTIQKMAQKRAMVAAILLAVNASEFFTQDIEDMVVDGDYTIVEQPKGQPKAQHRQPATEAEVDFGMGAQPDPGAALRQQFDDLGKELYGEQWDSISRHNAERVSNGAISDPRQLNADQLQKLITGMESLKRKRQATQQPKASQNGHKAGQITETQRNVLHALGMALHGSKEAWDTERPGFVARASATRTQSSNELWQAEAAQLIAELERRVREAYEKLAEELTSGIAVIDPGLIEEIDNLGGVELANSYKALKGLQPVAASA